MCLCLRYKVDYTVLSTVSSASASTILGTDSYLVTQETWLGIHSWYNAHPCE